jgi:hypothetical protein
VRRLEDASSQEGSKYQLDGLHLQSINFFKFQHQQRRHVGFGVFIVTLYHRERILKTSTLSCNEEKEEITKPPKR